MSVLREDKGRMAKKSLKLRAWRACSIYVRLREADSNGYVVCITCGVIMFWEDADAGHWVCGRNNTNLFDDAHIHPQCQKCNCAGGGEEYKYTQAMKKKYGYDDATVEEILNQKFVIKKLSDNEVREIYQNYKTEALRIAQEKGLTIRTKF